jgi:hypothetical protein
MTPGRQRTLAGGTGVGTGDPTTGDRTTDEVGKAGGVDEAVAPGDPSAEGFGDALVVEATWFAGPHDTSSARNTNARSLMMRLTPVR